MQAVKEKCQLAINTLENEPCLQRDATVCIGGPELGYHALRTALVAESEPVDQVGPLLVGAEMTAKTVFGNARDSFGNGREELSKVCVCVCVCVCIRGAEEGTSCIAAMPDSNRYFAMCAGVSRHICWLPMHRSQPPMPQSVSCASCSRPSRTMPPPLSSRPRRSSSPRR